MGDDFTLAEDEQDNRRRITLAGELDAATALRLEEAVARALHGGCGSLTVDLADVRFLDSGGVRAVLGAADSCAEYNCDLAFVPSRHPGPRSALRTLGIERMLPFTGPEASRERGDWGLVA